MVDSVPRFSHHYDESPGAVAKRGLRWDALAAVIASLVGLLALVVAGYTAYIQREQVRAQVWPYLQMGKSNARGQYELIATNKGVGPLIVRSVQVLADGKPVAGWMALRQLFGFEPTGNIVTSTLNQTVLAPGDAVHWITFQNTADVDAFVANWARFKVEARVCYSSTLGESWMSVFRTNAPSANHPVSSCPDVPVSGQFPD